MNTRSFSLVISLASVLVLPGCFSRPALVRQTFALEASAPLNTTNANGKGILSVGEVQVSPLFEGRPFVYRVAQDRYDADTYAGFMVPPSRAVAIPIRAFFRTSCMFQDVIEPGSRVEADTMLEVHATELYGDFRTLDQPAAVLSLRFVWFGANTGQGRKLLLQKQYDRRMQLKEQSAAALVAGWNQALAEIMKEAAADAAAAR